MIALSAREEWDFKLIEEREIDNPTVFVLRPLTLRARSEIEDLMRGDFKDVPMGTWKVKVLKAGLAGWRNLRDAGGREVACVFDRNGIPQDDTLARLPSQVQMELALEIFSRSALSDADRKN